MPWRELMLTARSYRSPCCQQSLRKFRHKIPSMLQKEVRELRYMYLISKAMRWDFKVIWSTERGSFAKSQALIASHFIYCFHFLLCAHSAISFCNAIMNLAISRTTREENGLLSKVGMANPCWLGKQDSFC